MKVIRAGVMGFCTGVRRAVEMAWGQSAAEGRGVYTLGPLIHNPVFLEDLERRGIGILKESDIPSVPAGSIVIIRAHGVSPAVERELLERGVKLLDATCPHVKQSQRKARDFAEKGYHIFLAGETNHAEIVGIRGYAEAACHVVGTPLEAGKAAEDILRLDPGAKTALIGQTTISAGEYNTIAEQIRKLFPGLVVVDTICRATADRQGALRELCGKVDAALIAGGGESSNTRRLLSLARELGKPAWLVETPNDIPREIAAYETVGLSAGASTPDSLVDEIEDALNTPPH